MTDPRSERPDEQAGRQRHASYGAVDDEISLADLFDALRRRWPIWVIATVLAAAVAVAFVASRMPQFAYGATVRIGSLPLLEERGNEHAALPIDTPENVVVELERRYLPAARRVTGASAGVSARRVGDSDMIELSSTAPAGAEGAMSRIMEHALTRLVADHREALAGRLNQLRGGMGSILNLPGLNREQNVEALEQALDLLDAPLDGDVVETHARVERLLRSADPLLRPTRVVALPERSGSPTGVSATVIVALALVLGLGAGVVLALLIDAITRERHRAPPPGS